MVIKRIDSEIGIKDLAKPRVFADRDFQGDQATRQALKIRSIALRAYFTAAAGALAAVVIFSLVTLEALCFLSATADLTATGAAAVAAGLAVGAAGVGKEEAANTLAAKTPVMRVAITFFICRPLGWLKCPPKLWSASSTPSHSGLLTEIKIYLGQLKMVFLR